jgi:hypothetical protein
VPTIQQLKLCVSGGHNSQYLGIPHGR